MVDILHNLFFKGKLASAESHEETDFNVLIQLCIEKRKQLNTLQGNQSSQALNDLFNRNILIRKVCKRVIRDTQKEKGALASTFHSLLQGHPQFTQVPTDNLRDDDLQEMVQYLEGISLGMVNWFKICGLQNKAIRDQLKKEDPHNLIVINETVQAEISIHDQLRRLVVQSLRKTKEINLKIDARKAGKGDGTLDARNVFSLDKIKFREILLEGRDFTGFYDIYKKAFPVDETESKKTLTSFLKARYSVDAVHATKHCIGAFYRGECIGGIFFECFQHGDFAFGILWWMVITQEYRGLKFTTQQKEVLYTVAERMVGITEELLQKNANSRNVTLKGVFAEINDPFQMSPDLIKEDVMNPHFRIKFWDKVGYKSCLEGYNQLLVYDKDIPVEENVIAEYCSLFVKPLTLHWKFHIPRDDLRDVVFTLATIANKWPPEIVKDFSKYKEMIAAINASRQHAIKEMNDEGLKQQVMEHRPTDYTKNLSKPVVSN